MDVHDDDWMHEATLSASRWEVLVLRVNACGRERLLLRRKL